jgi:hypothetical protein
MFERRATGRTGFCQVTDDIRNGAFAIDHFDKPKFRCVND